MQGRIIPFYQSIHSCSQSARACNKLLGSNGFVLFRVYCECTWDVPSCHTVYYHMMQRKVPDEGWDDLRIQLLLQELSLMDSNNFPGLASYLSSLNSFHGSVSCRFPQPHTHLLHLHACVLHATNGMYMYDCAYVCVCCVENVGVGEREARVYSNLVAQRHFR